MSRTERAAMEVALRFYMAGEGTQCARIISKLILEAKAEHDAEDRHNDWAEIDAQASNLEAA